MKVPGSVRIFNFCQTALKYFSSVQGLTTSNRRYSQKDPGLYLPDIPLEEVPAWDLRRLTLKQKGNNRAFISSKAKQSFAGRWLKRLVDSFPFNILIGDGGLIYIICGYFVGKRLVRRAGITHVFSTFRPYSDHFIAHLLKRRFPDLVWVADFRDLHLDEKLGRQVFFWQLQNWFNRWVLAKADLVTTVSYGLAKKLEAFAHPVTLLRNGIPSFSSPVSPIIFPYFSITYTGRIYPEEQSAILLFEVIADLIQRKKISRKAFRLTYAGPTPEYWQSWAVQSGLDDLLNIRGFVPLQEARKLQQIGAINLQLACSTPEQKGDLSSKVYEYLGSGKPILAIINGVKDPEFEAFFSQFDPGLLVYNDPSEKKAIEQFVLERYDAWKSRREEKWPKNSEAVNAFKTEHLFEAFFEKYL